MYSVIEAIENFHVNLMMVTMRQNAEITLEPDIFYRLVNELSNLKMIRKDKLTGNSMWLITEEEYKTEEVTVNTAAGQIKVKKMNIPHSYAFTSIDPVSFE